MLLHDVMLLRDSSLRLVFALLLLGGLAARAEAPLEKDREAQTQALIGRSYLALGRLDEAKTHCDAALKIDPASESPKDCLRRVASMQIDAELNAADAKLLQRDSKGAIELASKWVYAGTKEQRDRARRIISRLHTDPNYLFTAFTPEWLRDVEIALLNLGIFALLLIIVRRLWREWRRAAWYGVLATTTRWSMLPLKEIPLKENESPTGIATDHFLDSLIRLPEVLRRPLWKPRLLLLRPTPPDDHDPPIIEGILEAKDPPPIVLAPEPHNLGVEWKEHDVKIDEAIQNLQLRTFKGLDIGTLAKFLMSVVHWFNAGAPVISGVVQTAPDGRTSIHIAASGGKIQCVSVSASTAAAAGIDAVQLTAQRAAFKFLLRMRMLSDNEVEGFAALRQAVILFGQYAPTVRGTHGNAQTRDSSLRQAASDFGVFRGAIPVDFQPSRKITNKLRTMITDEVRQAALLAEGLAYAIDGNDEDLTAAVVCFRELQDWPGSPATVSLRRQAAYNEALLWRQKGSYSRAVLMFTELLGEDAPDVRPKAARDENIGGRFAMRLPAGDTLRYPVRLGRLGAFAQYTLQDWKILPKGRIELLIGDAERLVEDLKELRRTPALSEREKRVAHYMHQETLRAIGHVEVLRVVTGPAEHLYDENHRPVGLKTKQLPNEDQERLQKAIEWMQEAEDVLPTSTLYCDLAEAHLLLKKFEAAGGYARHATLEKEHPSERAFYLAAESYLMQGTPTSHAFAQTYASQFPAPTLPEFIALRAELQVGR
ncbi:MAG TPA: tetratricopeptide repeat protein [Bryobacteraceae bacterium]|nr:tetratricopeptide repeat protein [Bryobacteraceae bacterium]